MEIDIPDTVWFESEEWVHEWRPERLCFTHAVKAVMNGKQVTAKLSSRATYHGCDICRDDEAVRP